MKSLVLLLLGVLAHGLPSFNKSDTTVELVAATWYAGWHADVFPLANVSWEKYTHVTYSFAETTNNVSLLDLSGSEPDMLPKFVQKAQEEGVNALVSIGGWTGSRFFSDNVASAENRTAFVTTVTHFATQYHLDGIDFDWEEPGVQGIGCNTILPNDTSNFLEFLKELREHPVGSQLIITAAAGITPWPDTDGNPSNVTEFAALFDYVAIMNYDIWGSWSQAVGPDAPLNDTCASPDNQQGSAVSAVEAWHNAGMPLYQIVLGVPYYGHSFTVNQTDALTNGTLNLYTAYDPVQPKGDAWDDEPGPDVCGVEQTYGGVWDFWALVEEGFLKTDGTNLDGIHYRWNDCSQTPFVYNATSEIMISYDNPQSMQDKGAFIKSTGLRGFAAWETAGDYNDLLLDAVRAGAGFEGPEDGSSSHSYVDISIHL